jgi:hypothetical protein
VPHRDTIQGRTVDEIVSTIPSHKRGDEREVILLYIGFDGTLPTTSSVDQSGAMTSKHHQVINPNTNMLELKDIADQTHLQAVRICLNAPFYPPMSRQTSPHKAPERPLSLALWNFSSSWFLMPQGTGVTCTLLHRLHYQFT